MAARLANLTMSEVLANPFDSQLYFPCMPGQPQATRFDLQKQLMFAHMELKRLSAQKEQWKTAYITQHGQHLWEVQQRDAQLQQQEQQLALQQQQLKQQSLEAAELRKKCEGQQMKLGVLERVLAARPKQQQKSKQDTCRVSIAPAAFAATPRAGRIPGRAILSARPSSSDGKGGALADSADGVKLPETPSPVDSRATYSLRSSSSSNDGCNSNDSSMPKEQTASADSSWWWQPQWNPLTSATTSSITSNSATTTNSSNKGCWFSDWWGAETAVDMAIGAAGDILYL